MCKELRRSAGPRFNASEYTHQKLIAESYRVAVAANFFTIASSSLRSLSFRFEE